MKDAAPGRLELSTDRRRAPEGETKLIRAEGEVDLSNARELAHELGSAATDGTRVVVDLTGVPFMDSSGLRVVLVAARDLGSRIAVVVGRGSPVLNLFEMAGVLDRIPSFPTEEEALAAVGDAERTDG